MYLWHVAILQGQCGGLPNSFHKTVGIFQSSRAALNTMNIFLEHNSNLKLSIIHPLAVSKCRKLDISESISFVMVIREIVRENSSQI